MSQISQEDKINSLPVKIKKENIINLLSNLHLQLDFMYNHYGAFIKLCFFVGFSLYLIFLLKFSDIQSMIIYQKIFISSPIILLALSGNNFLNIIWTVREYKTKIFDIENRIIINDSEEIEIEEIIDMHDDLIKKSEENNRNYQCGYILLTVAMINLIVVFYWLLFSEVF